MSISHCFKLKCLILVFLLSCFFQEKLIASQTNNITDSPEYIHLEIKGGDHLVLVEDLSKEKKIKFENQVLFSRKELEAFKEQNRSISKTSKWLICTSVILVLLNTFYFFIYYRNVKLQKANNHQQVLTDSENIIKSQFEKYFENNPNQISSNNIKETKITKMSDFLIDNLKSENDWDDFVIYFTKVHKDFFKNLKTTYPKITANELNLCALIKLNLLNNEIAEVLGISTDSVRKAQQRLARKMEIENTETLKIFIIKY